jgi:protein-tyrosine phosphatase
MMPMGGNMTVGRIGSAISPLISMRSAIGERARMTLLRVERLGDEVKGRDMLWFHLPIVDVSIPDEQFEQQWEDGRKLRELLHDKRDVLIHCRGGLGRAGTIAARLLVEFGMEPDEAIR